MRVLGVDFGAQRIGLAVGETGPRIASPRKPIRSLIGLKKIANVIAAAASNEKVDAIVVGVPEADGEPSPQARICRQLGEELTKLGCTVYYADESLTSIEAEREMRLSGLKAAARRRAIDGESACRILERFFTTHGE